MKRSPIRRRSKKTAKKYRDERVPFVKHYLATHPNCEAGTEVCTGRSEHVHEPLTRARGGSITDAENALAVCWSCHRWVHDHPAESLEQGWLRRA